MKLKKWVRVRIPASSSNFGPGFDALGLALRLYNEIELEAERSPEHQVAIEIRGEGAGVLPKNEQNVIWQSVKKIFKSYRLPLASYRFHLKAVNRIPLSRGLGSSAAARLSGILAANAMARSFMSQGEILDWAVKMEGHPDNVVPQLIGNFCVCAVTDHRIQFVKISLPKSLSVVVCLPDFELPTKKARAVLPKQIAHQSAAFNVARVALLVGALCKGDAAQLRTAMEDKLHQNYRKRLVPGFDAVMRQAYRNGALGVALSGSGPSILAFAPKHKARQVGLGMEKGFCSAGKKSKSLILSVDDLGAQVKTD